MLTRVCEGACLVKEAGIDIPREWKLVGDRHVEASLPQPPHGDAHGQGQAGRQSRRHCNRDHVQSSEDESACRSAFISVVTLHRGKD